jgi:hypothetical protein
LLLETCEVNSLGFDRSFQRDARERAGHAGQAGMASNGIASAASAVRPEIDTASGV